VSATAREFDDVLAALGLAADADDWREGWADSQEAYDAEGAEFLTAAFVEDTCRFMGMSAEPAAALRDALPALNRNEALRRLAWHGHCRLFRQPTDEHVGPRDWPDLPEHLGDAGRLFYGYVYLSGVPRLRQSHRSLGIDEAVTVDTLSDIEVWMRDYHDRHGRWGLGRKEWLWLDLSGKVFKLGRLQFEMRFLQEDLHAFRHEASGRVVVFAGDGQRFREDGQFDGVNGVFDEAGAWMSRFAVADGFVEGNPIVDGATQRQAQQLQRDCWHELLGQGDPVLGVHIPATGPLVHGQCLESYGRALAFFRRHFPEHRFRAFHCCSWLLDCQLADYLPADSNIVVFLREWHLLPAPRASDSQTIERVFGPDVTDPSREPLLTSLQRAIVAHMTAGKRWRTAGGLIFPERFEQGVRS